MTATQVFLLWSETAEDPETEISIVTLIGCYSSRSRAEAQREQEEATSADGSTLTIDAYALGERHWTEGFFSW